MANPIKTKLGKPVPELPVLDVERAQAYYRDVLGFEIAWTLDDKSMGTVGQDGIAIFLRNILILRPLIGSLLKILTPRIKK